ncbi:unnamed protein product [Sympodiomycopsis kandeliae]
MSSFFDSLNFSSAGPSSPPTSRRSSNYASLSPRKRRAIHTTTPRSSDQDSTECKVFWQDPPSSFLSEWNRTNPTAIRRSSTEIGRNQWTRQDSTLSNTSTNTSTSSNASSITALRSKKRKSIKFPSSSPSTFKRHYTTNSIGIKGGGQGGIQKLLDDLSVRVERIHNGLDSSSDDDDDKEIIGEEGEGDETLTSNSNSNSNSNSPHSHSNSKSNSSSKSNSASNASGSDSTLVSTRTQSSSLQEKQRSQTTWERSQTFPLTTASNGPQIQQPDNEENEGDEFGDFDEEFLKEIQEVSSSQLFAANHTNGDNQDEQQGDGAVKVGNFYGDPKSSLDRRTIQDSKRNKGLTIVSDHKGKTDQMMSQSESLGRAQRPNELQNKPSRSTRSSMNTYKADSLRTSNDDDDDDDDDIDELNTDQAQELDRILTAAGY